jgi:CRP-like cAMP-binding protein
MPIEIDLLTAWGGTSKIYTKGEIIFHEGDLARCYYQIINGEVKMFSISHDGKEFMQGIFTDGQSFGEAPLLINKPYPTTATALKDTTIIRLGKDDFIKLLKEYPGIAYTMLEYIALRTYNKAITLREIINNNPEARIIAFLDAKKPTTTSDKKIIVPYTRQQIANFTGLRVETVIRALAKLNSQKKVEIINRKLYY